MKEYHAYNDYKKNKRFNNWLVPKFEKMMKEERKKLKEFKLRKQYSKNYQVVEIEVTGDIDDFDVSSDWLDEKMSQEMSAIPAELLVKDNSGKTGGYSKPYKKETTPQKYSKQRKEKPTGDRPKPFGTEKQWYHILKEDNQEFLQEEGLTVEDIDNYQDLQAALKAIRDAGLW